VHTDGTGTRPVSYSQLHVFPTDPIAVRLITLRTLCVALTGVLLLFPGDARAQVHDSLPRQPLFTSRDAWMGLGVTAGVVLLSLADLEIRRAVRDDDVQSERYLIEPVRAANRINETTLTIGGIALWGIGRLAGKSAMADMALHTVEGVVAASVVSQLIRGPLGRARPRVNNEDQYDFNYFQGFRNFDYRAFPSIHTSSAFAAAAVLTGEANRRWPGRSWWVGPVAYTIAATPGLARMYLDQHWASDIAMGAFIGIVAGQKVVKYNHEIAPGNKADRFFLGRGEAATSQQTRLGVQLRF
jgi:membrane-associated phospholipid phosphatase